MIHSYDCKQIPVGFLHVEKMTVVALLNVFRIGFPAPLLLQKSVIQRRGEDKRE